jgi:hypothetical protein
MTTHAHSIERAAFDVLARWTDEQGRDWHGELSHGGRTPTGIARDLYGTKAPSGEQLDAVDQALAMLGREGVALRLREAVDGRPAPPLYLAPSTTEEGVAFCEERVAHYERAAALWRRSPADGAEAAAARAEREADEWRDQARRWREAEAVRTSLRETRELSLVA